MKRRLFTNPCYLLCLLLTALVGCKKAEITPQKTAEAPAVPAPPAALVIPENVEVLHDVVIGTGGGRPLHAEVARPKILPKEPMPAVILIHGGGWARGSQKDSRLFVFLASHGYFAASVEYRLTGEAKWPAQIEDCKLGVRWLRANAAKYHVDPNRIASIGGSAGGHLALCLAVMEKESQFEGEGGYPGVSSAVQAVVDTNGPADLKRDRPDLFGGTLAEMPEVYKAASPLNYVRKGLPPMIVFHGDKDETVPFVQSSRLVEALEKAGVKVKFVVFKDGGHDLTSTPAGKEKLWNETLAWLDETLKK